MDDERRRQLDQADIVIRRTGRPYEVVQPSRRIATCEFAEDLRRWGLTVEVAMMNGFRSRLILKKPSVGCSMDPESEPIKDGVAEADAGYQEQEDERKSP
jgi:hypothetical protein